MQPTPQSWEQRWGLSAYFHYNPFISWQYRYTDNLPYNIYNHTPPAAHQNHSSGLALNGRERRETRDVNVVNPVGGKNFGTPLTDAYRGEFIQTTQAFIPLI